MPWSIRIFISNGLFRIFSSRDSSSFCFWIREWSYFDRKWVSKNTTSYSVFTTFDVNLRKALCDCIWFVKRAYIANKKSNIDQFFQYIFHFLSTEKMLLILLKSFLSLVDLSEIYKGETPFTIPCLIRSMRSTQLLYRFVCTPW